MSFWKTLFGGGSKPQTPPSNPQPQPRAAAPAPPPKPAEQPKPATTLKLAELGAQVQQIETDDTPRYVDPASVTCGFICFPNQMSKLVTEELGHQALQTNKTELWNQVTRVKSVPMHLVTSNQDIGPRDALVALDKLGKYDGQSVGMDNMQLSPDGGRTLVIIYIGFTYKSPKQEFLLAAPQMILPKR